MNSFPKFIVIVQDGNIQEVYSSSEMEYAIINLDLTDPVEGVYEAVDIGDSDLKSLFEPAQIFADPVKDALIYKRLSEESF